jgi:NAD(P)-dependent dehydrogenase (short-subunit alcohol dehydrogenase family)
MNLKGKNIIIFGGTKGIGHEVAIQAATAGANVMVVGRNTPPEVEQESYRHISFFRCDVANEEDVKNAMHHFINKHGRLDLAFNNAGITSSYNKVAESSSEEWRKVIDTNLNGIYYAMKYEIQAMKDAGGGAIVNMSSAAGVLPIGMQAAYVASKAAVIALTKSAAGDYAANKTGPIRINAIAPGPVMGGMNTQERLEAEPEKTAKKVAVTAMRRFGNADEISKAVLWLLSDESSYVTGAVLSIDGGYSAVKI